jgi:hypothetical protein
MSFDLENETLADPKALLNVRVGMASPLWPLFAGAAVSGAAWWWMTRWARSANLEAMFGATAKAIEAAPEPAALMQPVTEAVVESVAEAGSAAEAVVDAAAAPVVEAVTEAAPVVEAAAETVSETVEAVAEPIVDATPEPVLEALAETTADLQPVGGEAAPISPVLEAFAAEVVSETAQAGAKPKARKKVAELQPDNDSAAD